MAGGEGEKAPGVGVGAPAPGARLVTWAAAAVFTAAVLLAGCEGESAEPSDAVVVDIAVADGQVTPQGDRVEMTVGQTELILGDDSEASLDAAIEPVASITLPRGLLRVLGASEE